MSEYPQQNLAGGIVAGGEVHKKRPPVRLPRREVRLLLLFVILVLVGFVGIKGLATFIHNRHIKTEASGLSNDYAGLSNEQVDVKLQAMGFSLATVKSGSVKTTDTKTFAQAYGVGQAYVRFDKYNEAAMFYKVAASKAPANVDPTFYANYASVALTTGDETLWQAQLANEKAAINRNAKIPEAQKQQLTQAIDAQVRHRKLGY